MNYSVLGFYDFYRQKIRLFVQTIPGAVNGFSRIIKDDEAPFSVMSDVFHIKRLELNKSIIRVC